MSPPIVNHGTPVVSSRQWATGFSPNKTNDGWNYIAMSWTGVNPDPGEWVVLRNLTTSPVEVIYQQPTHLYANTNISYIHANQLRAQNGRIFRPLASNYTAYYDPTTESI